MTTLVTDPGRKTPAQLASSAILGCQPNQRLVELVRSGHERAFDAIVERYRGPLVGYCRRILPESRCEDAVQQAFINAHSALLASDEPVQLKPWLFAIARNAALNMLRQNGWNYEQIPLDFDGVRRPDQVFDQRIELQQTVDALRDLPERQREALVMREFEGRSYEEIAVALGTGDGAVRQLLNRARVTLRGAASALIPSSLVERAASLAGGDGGGLAQIAGGLGAAGVAKAGATALIAGSLVVGVANAPLPISASHSATREKATLTTAQARAASSPGRERGTGLTRQGSPAPGTGSGSAREGSRNRDGSGRVDGSHERSGSGDVRDRSGVDDSPGGFGSSRRSQHSDDRSGTSGSGSGLGASGSGSGSSSSGSGSSGSGSGSSSGDGGGSSGELTSTSATSRSSGTSSSGSGSGDSRSSGSGTSGSGASGSGTSGSGTSGSGTSGSGTSGSGTSGSGTSGSGSSGSADAIGH